jgi:bile acid-coenzyme A ligase
LAMMSMGRGVGWLSEQDPDRPCITHEGRTVTRLELEKRTNRLARAYADLGVGQDDLVTIGLFNGIEFYEACIAVWKLGATPQLVSAKLPKAELEAIVELANPPLVIGVLPGSLGARHCIAANFEPDPALSDEVLPERTATYQKANTSGGSTGRPKLIVSNMPGEFDTELVLKGTMKRNGTHLVVGPLYHGAPFTFSIAALFGGSHVIVMSRFDAEQTLELIEMHRVDYIVLVPTMMHRIWRLGEEVRNQYDLSSLEVVMHLSAPCPAWLKLEWINWLGPARITEAYAGTEGQGSTLITGEEWLSHRGSVGKPIEGSSMRVLDADGKELPPGEVGEVFILPDAGQGSTYHYIGAQAKSLGEWESLGDMGYMDEEGYLYLSDRATDMILSGGANIYPAEIEAALDAHPKVESSAVIGLPDEDMGQLVHAIVQTTEPVTDEELIEHLAQLLVRYKIPRSFEYVDTPLRNDAGKVRRSALLAERTTVPA